MVGRNPKSVASDAIDTISILLDAIPASKENTSEFEDIRQEEICDALKYWIDQTKTFFGEPVQVMIFHNPREEGIDMSIDLLKSKVKFGIQVKTYGDIQKTKSFADKIHSQINRSRKHNITKCVLAFAGDLTSQSQNLKVTGAIGEIHQTNEDYVLVIPPVNLMTILKVYRNKDNPSQFINLNTIERALILGRGISKALTNDKREAKVTINIHYLHSVGDDKGLKVSLRVKGSDYNLWDRIENANPGEEVRITKDQIEEFNVTDHQGNPVVSEKIDSDLIIQPEKKYLSMNLQIVSLKGKILDSIDNYKFEVKKRNSIVRWEAADENESCRFSLQYDVTTNIANINFALETFRGDAKKLVKRLNFLKTINTNSKLRMVRPGTNRGQILGLPNKLPSIPEGLYNLISDLAMIQEKTGYAMILPRKEGISRDSLQKILFVAKAVKTGRVTLQKLNFTATFPRVVALSLLHRYLKEEKLDKFSFPYEMYMETVLDKQIPLGPAKLTSPSGKPMGDIKKTYANLNRSKVKHIQIEFELQKPEFEFDWFTKSKKQTGKNSHKTNKN